MIIRKESIRHFLPRIEPEECSGVVGPYSMAGFSDAEWSCVLGHRLGERTGLGQVIDRDHGLLLLDVLRRRQADPRFFFAVPECLNTLPGFSDGEVDWFLGSQGIKIEAVERDRLTDDLARQAEMFPFIDRLREMPVVFIGPKELRGMRYYLSYKHFVEVSSPNLHLEPEGIDRAVGDARCWGEANGPAVYLVSAGVSAAVIIDHLHDVLQGSWLIDCGSIWDAFVGIGGQRQWRAELYANPHLLEEWKRKNLWGGHR